MPFGFQNILLLLAAGQGFFLALLILHKYGRIFANRFLSLLMFLYSLILLNLLLTDLGFPDEYPRALLLPLGFTFLIAPLHYLYARYLLHYGRRFRWGDAGHFLPFGLYLILILPVLFQSEGSSPDFPRAIDSQPMPVDSVLFNWFLVLQGLIYMGLVLNMLRHYALSLRSLFSSIEDIKLEWLRNITLMTTGCWLIFAMENTLMMAGINLSNFDLSSVLVAVAVYAMGYLGFFNSEILVQPGAADSIRQATDFGEIREAGGPPTLKHGGKYEKSGLSPEKAEAYVASLRKIVEEEQLYTDSTLTLNQLAERLDISPHNLSEIINTRLGQNFFDFVNAYRLEAVKRDLADPQKAHFTILALALDAGFNSKTAFNGIFKKHTGMTPSDYRRRRLSVG